MKVNNDLIRVVLLRVEASPEPMDPAAVVVAGYSSDEMAYHVQILHEAGFIEAENVTTHRSYAWRPKRITDDGHEFLNAIRDPEAWRFTKETAKNAGVASVKALCEIAKTYAKRSS